MTARGDADRIAVRAAARAGSAQARSVSANVRTSRVRATRATATLAPARRSAPASASSAARRPAVPPMRDEEDVGARHAVWHSPRLR